MRAAIAIKNSDPTLAIPVDDTLVSDANTVTLPRTKRTLPKYQSSNENPDSDDGVADDCSGVAIAASGQKWIVYGGRNFPMQNSAGNVTLRATIRDLASQFFNGTKNEKKAICEHIVSRFVFREPDGSITDPQVVRNRIRVRFGNLKVKWQENDNDSPSTEYPQPPEETSDEEKTSSGDCTAKSTVYGGRSSNLRSRVGNKQLRQVVEQRKEEFLASDFSEKNN